MKTENLADTNPVSLESLNWRQLSPETIFWVMCEKSAPQSFVESWQFEVVGLLEGVAEVTATFPSGLEKRMFFEGVKVGGVLKIFFSPEKNGHFVDWDVIDILLWQ